MNKIPILIIIFNRPKKFKKMIQALKKTRPRCIYIFANGPRDNHEKDIKLCDDTRNLIKKINWKCKIYTNFKKKILELIWEFIQELVGFLKKLILV